MDYEQKYNKLVNAIKLLQEANPSDEGIQNWVNDNVPELAESEGERIKKEIIEIVMQPTWKTEKEFHRRKELCDWIEKQGKQKPIDWSKHIKYNPNSPSIIKESDWSEEDESMYTRTLGILGKCYMGQLPTKVEEELKWFKSIRDRVIPQQKSAWSEEDEERLQSCLNILQVQAKGFMGITETINTKWLKSLKQRHTWKPSDEQINSLEYIIDNAQYLPYSHSVVNELLEQLKKLKRG